MRSVWLLGILTACAAAPPPAASTPPSPPAAERPAASAPEDTPKQEAASPPLAVPPPPAECAAFVEAPTGCGANTPLADALATALEKEAPLERDRALACVEHGAPTLSGLLRALRAELAPLACADALITPLLEAGGATNPEDENTAIGLLLAARLSRLVASPPTLAPPFDKARFFEFFEQELKPWMIAQAMAVGRLSLEASRLQGYGKAVAAIEAALSDLRFVQVVRAVPLPSELDQDVEARNVYYAALDEALEPRKARGRDAALVALRIMGELGALADARVGRARALLSELYAGSRVDALDRLLLPELPPLSGVSVEQRLARRLPPHYAARLTGVIPELARPALLRDYVEQGLAPEYRRMLDGATLDAQSRFLYAWSEARRGVIYFSGPAFARAAELVGSPPHDDGAALLAALGAALAGAPKDTAAFMASAAQPPRPFGDLQPLETLAKGAGRYAGEAAFDAAYLRYLTPPQNDAAFWDGLARSFGRAARRLKSPAARALATEYADAARKTAQSLER